MGKRKGRKVVHLVQPPTRDTCGLVIIKAGQTWVQKDNRDAVWIVAEVLEVEETKKKRIFLQTEEGLVCEKSYSEVYFRRNWEMLYELLRKENKKKEKIPTQADIMRMVSSR